MAERAAHLVDHVFPPVPVRQAGVPAARFLRGGVEWVLSLPHRIRYVLAWDHALCRAVVGVFMRAVLGFLRRRAREQQGVANGRGGAGGGDHPALSTPLRTIRAVGTPWGGAQCQHPRPRLVVDGVYAEDGSGGLCFHPATPPTDEEMEELLDTIARRIDRLLARRGVVDGGEHGPDRWAEEVQEQGLGEVRAPLALVHLIDEMGDHPRCVGGLMCAVRGRSIAPRRREGVA